MRTLGWMVLGLLLLTLNGCAFFDAATLDDRKDSASAKTAGPLTVVIPRIDADQLDDELKFFKQTALGKSLEGVPIPSECLAPGYAAAAEAKAKEKPVFLGSAALAATLVVSEVATEISGEINGYVTKKQAEFTPSAQTAVFDVGALMVAGKPDFGCIIVGQQTKPSTPPDENAPVAWDFIVVAQLVSDNPPPVRSAKAPPKISPQAYKLVPIYYNFTQSTALTTKPSDSSRGKVTVTLDIVLSAVTSAAKEAGPIVDAKIVLPKIELGSCSATVDGTTKGSCGPAPVDPKKPGAVIRLMPIKPVVDTLALQATPWFSLPDPTKTDTKCDDVDCFPAAVTITLTQAGDGAPDFATAHTEINSAATALTTLLGKAVSK